MVAFLSDGKSVRVVQLAEYSVTTARGTGDYEPTVLWSWPCREVRVRRASNYYIDDDGGYVERDPPVRHPWRRPKLVVKNWEPECWEPERKTEKRWRGAPRFLEWTARALRRT